MPDLPDGTPIKEISWERLQEVQSNIFGWVYPRRNISPFISGFPRAQQLALGLYSNGAIVMFIAGVVLPFVMGSLWWALLIPGAVALWKINRKSMEQFFLKNLRDNQTFYEAVRQSSMGDIVKVVLRDS